MNYKYHIGIVDKKNIIKYLEEIGYKFDNLTHKISKS